MESNLKALRSIPREKGGKTGFGVCSKPHVSVANSRFP